jgi:UDP-glucuronate 4-epimerase
MRILVTGGAGFIGSHLVDRLIAEGAEVTVLDSFDPFYDPRVKLHNVSAHSKNSRFRLVEGDIRDLDRVESDLPAYLDVIVHLAARAGVRPSIVDPVGYQDVNVAGTQNVLELARKRGVGRFVFASSSSVYGVNPNTPWSESDNVLRPISPYASTKVSGELLGHVYSHLYGMRFTALRLFTVYGPRQRPDLAIHKFSRHILSGKPIPVYGDGSTVRDYTYVSDVVEGIRAAMEYDGHLFDIFNLGNDRPVSLQSLIGLVEETLQTRAEIERLPEQPGDLRATWANIDRAARLLHYRPQVDLASGLSEFADWIRNAH